jgi:hypothetical protein
METGMPTTLRIDDIQIDPDSGSVNISYTEGRGTLPAEASGQGVEYASRQALRQMIVDAEASLSIEQRVAMALAGWFRADNQMRNTATARGKSVTLDLGGAAAPIVLS